MTAFIIVAVIVFIAIAAYAAGAPQVERQRLDTELNALRTVQRLDLAAQAAREQLRDLRSNR